MHVQCQQRGISEIDPHPGWEILSVCMFELREIVMYKFSLITKQVHLFIRCQKQLAIWPPSLPDDFLSFIGQVYIWCMNSSDLCHTYAQIMDPCCHPDAESIN